jgi:hypothetical protein
MKDRSIRSWVFGAFSFFTVFAALRVADAAEIHVTYLWHMHQPIYYPYETVNQTDANGRFNFSVGGVHNDRTGNYTTWPKSAVQQGADRGMAHAGAQCSFSGSLGENLNNLWGSGWPGDYRWARNGLRTSLNNPRLDMVGIAYHHSLMPLTCYESMRMQIKLHKEIYKELWDTQGYSKGFWPPECAFATWIIPALVDEGLEWVLIDNGHFDRACQNYPWVDATSIRPNPADQLNADPATIGSQWVQLNNVWAPSKVSAPWGYQPHYVKHVDPYTGTEKKMIGVPCGRYEGNENGRGGYGAFKPENVWGTHAANGINNDPAHPMLLVCHSDGDNYGMKNADAWHAQHGNFLSMCQANSSFENSTVQDYLDMYPPSASDVVHVEPGSWVGIDGGTPYFDKWREQNGGYAGDPNEHPDFWSWSVIVAAQNRVLHADLLENSYSMNDVQWGIGSDTAKAWHFYLQAETSCHWYWDYDRANPWDGNTTRGCNLAIAEANKVIARHSGTDPRGPSIFPPQRNIYNPGGKHWNETTNQPSDFQVWTFIDDVSGVAEARLYYRADLDGQNPINENDNEVYAHNGAKVGAWNMVLMTNSWYPAGKGPQVPTPSNRAQKYDATIAGQNNVLLDYYIEAVDGAGKTNRSDIMHVFVGQSSAASPVTFSPTVPYNCPTSTLLVVYNSAGRNLASANPVSAVIRFTGAGTSNEVTMSGSVGGLWSYTSAIPSGASSAIVYFKNGGTVDNNNTQNWSIAISTCSVPASCTFDPPAPNGCGPIKVIYEPNDGPLDGAAQVYIHIGYNTWRGVITPDPAMTLVSGRYEYVYSPPVGAAQVNVAFNNGSNTWDSNNGANYNVSVANCNSTNATVVFQPGAPRDCDTLSVTYNPAGRPISGGSQYYLTVTYNNWATYTNLAMTDNGDGTWVRSNAVPVGATAAIVNFRTNTTSSTVDDNGGTNWSVAVSACSTSGPSTVAFSPTVPNGCVAVTITYSANNGPLAGATQVIAHVGYNQWQGVVDAAMAPQTNGTWTYTYGPPPAGADRINVCFNDGAGTWDNNATLDWLVTVVGCASTQQGVRFASGSPLVNQGPTNQQNHVGENFDLSQAGGYASTSNQGGFGSFGAVFVNYDANNFYIGGVGVDMAGSNNAMAIFLEFDTLGDNQNNLWAINGLPQGLDLLHNVWFNDAVDIALLLGDEWGDGTFTNFNLANGYDMGQGAYYTSGSGSFVPVAGAYIAQFDGTGTVATTSSDDDGNRLTRRWKASIPWSSIGSTNGINGITNCTLYGLFLSDGTSGNDRYISGNFLASGASANRDAFGNYGITNFLTMSGLRVGMPLSDSNGNGVPDAWEMSNFGSLGLVTLLSDWDGDGHFDRYEYGAGTNPKDGTSCFEATAASSVAGGLVIRWQSVSGKEYDLYRCTNMADGIFQPIASNIAAVLPENTYTDMTFTAGPVFYRIETE